MMDLDKDEIAEELAYHKEMLRLYRRRLRELERKQAQYGINTPAEIITEIHDLTASIQRHEAEIARLQTDAAVDKLSIAEAEYRARLAKAWDMPEGHPTVVGATQLEYDRLRLGIASERAQELEREVRKELAKEAVSSVNRYKILERVALINRTALHQHSLDLALQRSIQRQCLIIPPFGAGHIARSRRVGAAIADLGQQTHHIRDTGALDQGLQLCVGLLVLLPVDLAAHNRDV